MHFEVGGKLLIMMYIGIIYSLISEYFIFDKTPDTSTIIGSGMIFSCSVIIFIKNSIMVERGSKV